MNPAVVASAAAALILTGLLVGGVGFIPVAESRSKPRPITRTGKVKRATLLRAAIGAVVGMVASLMTGWVVLIVVVPAVAVLGPELFGGGGGQNQLKRLDALDEWSRSLAGVLGAGVNLEQAIVATQSSAPEALHKEINTLIARVKSRMSLEDALRLFATDVDDATCDKIVCTLLLVSKRGDGGLVRILEDLSASVAEEVSARRMVEAERAKQTTVVRIVTLITVVVIGGFLLLGGTYTAPYGTPLGQLVLLVLLATYVGVLLWLRQMNHAEPLPRLLTQPQAEGVRA